MKHEASMIVIALLASTGLCDDATRTKSPQSTGEKGQDLAYVNGIVREYANQKRKQMETAASNEGFRVDDHYHHLFDCIATDDEKAASNAYTWIRQRTGQYERRPGGPEPDPDLKNPWQYVLDAHGFMAEVSHWTPRFLRIYASDILNSIPSNAVLFAGTDPGRFVLSAFNDVIGTNRLMIVTQNALSDNLYMAYVHRLYGDRMSLPTISDSSKAFQIYVDEVQSGKRPKNAQLDIKDGRVTVEGVLGVMEINGILAQMIFDRNKHDRQFFVEESYAIPWMYPFLTPHGLILRLNSEPTPLTDAMAAADHEFWGSYEKTLRGQEAFSVDTSAQKTYSKLRSAIGGVYAFRGRLEDAEKAFEQARRLFPESPEAHYGLGDVLLRQNRFADALRVMNGYRDRLPRWVEICAKDGVTIELRTEQGLVDGAIEHIKRLEKQRGAGKGDGVPVDKTEAAKWYRKAAEQGDAEAQNKLGVCYVMGEGVPVDKAEAAKWYRKAAEQRHAKGQYNLGMCYDYGVGVPVDKTEAAKWYRRAARRGNADAKKALDKIGDVTLPTIKIKGLYLGMDMEEAAEIWKKYVPEEGRAHSIIEKKEEEGYCLELTIGQGYRSVGCVYADLNEEVTAFHFYTSGVDILFNSPGLKPSDFVEQFANAYNVPMQHSYDARGVYWEYRSPDGVKIVIRRQLVGLYDDIEAVSLSITKGKSEQEIKQSFD